MKIDVRKLEVFNRVSKEGSRRVADSLTQMTGMDAEIKVSKINVMHMDDGPIQMKCDCGSYAKTSLRKQSRKLTSDEEITRNIGK